MHRTIHHTSVNASSLKALKKTTKSVALYFLASIFFGCGSQELPAPKTNDCISTTAIAGASKKIIIQVDNLTTNPKWIVSVKDTKSNELKLHPTTSSFTITAGFVDKGQDYHLSFFLCGQDAHPIPVNIQVFQDGVLTYVKTHLTNETIAYTVL